MAVVFERLFAVAVAPLPTYVLLEPVVLANQAWYPRAVFPFPVVLFPRDSAHTEVFPVDVLWIRLHFHIATLSPPVWFDHNDWYQNAVLKPQTQTLINTQHPTLPAIFLTL